MDRLFDTLAKGLATGSVSRRETLQRVGAALGVSVLATFGIGCAPEAEPVAPDGFDGPDAAPPVARGSLAVVAGPCAYPAYQPCVGRAEAVYVAALPQCRSASYTAVQTSMCLSRAAAKRAADLQLCTQRAGCASGTDVCTAVGTCAPASPAPQTVAGTRTGTARLGGETLRLQFTLTVSGAALGGTARFWEPASGRYVEVGTITGTLNGTAARWTLPTGGVIEGAFAGPSLETFTGTLTLVPAPGASALTAAVELTR